MSSVNEQIVDDMWLYDDYLRRVSQRLFDLSAPRARQARNRRYRLGLLALIHGLIDENAFDVQDGVDEIASTMNQGTVRQMVKGDIDG